MIFNRSQIKLAADLIKEGKVIAFPTETVYGLGASIFQKQAIQQIFLIKKRPSDNPLIAHISCLEQLETIVHCPPADFFRLADRFFPGPLTILLRKKNRVPSLASANLSTIGVRMPSHPLALALIECVGSPLVAPSANLSGKPSSTTAQHVLNDFGQEIAGVIDGGPCQIGIESTVITLFPRPTILRPGAVTQEELEEILQQPVAYAHSSNDQPLSPGMKYRHYAPQAKVVLFDDPISLEAHLHAAPFKKRLPLYSITPNQLYSLLRQADDEAYQEILILCTPAIKAHPALMNRLQRATSHYDCH